MENGFIVAGTEAQFQVNLSLQPGLIEPGLTALDRELVSGAGQMDLYARDSQ